MLTVTYTDKHWNGRTATWLTTQEQLDWLQLKLRMGMYATMTILRVERTA